MLEFAFIAKDKQGNHCSDSIFATSERKAIDILHAHDYTIIRLDVLRQRSLFDRLFRKVKPELKILVFRQLSTMLTAGIPMMRTLAAVSKNEGLPERFHRALQQIAVSVRSGYSLSQALRLFPEYFSPFMVGSIRIGEVSGELATTISNCAEHLNREHTYELRLRQALIYPTVLLVGLTLLMTFCFVYMIPIFLGLFQEAQLELPTPTRILICITDFLRDYGLALLAALAPFLAWGGWSLRRTLQTENGRIRLEQLALKIPWLGHQLKLRWQSNYLRSLATLIDSSVPISSSLTLLSKCLDCETLRQVASIQFEQIKQGHSFAFGFKKSGFFKPLVWELVRIGERTGTLALTLHRLASALDEEMSSSLQLAGRLIEPIVLAVLGVGITFVLLAVFLPIYSLAQSF